MLRSNSPVDVLDSYICFFLHFLSLYLYCPFGLSSQLLRYVLFLSISSTSLGEWVGGQSKTGLIIYMFA